MRCLFIFFACCLSLNLSAQTGGVLINCVEQNTHKPIVACIKIEGDTILASGCTEIDGKKKFSQIPSGTIWIHITHNGDTLVPRTAFIQTNQLLQMTVEISSYGSAQVAQSNVHQNSINGQELGATSTKTIINGNLASKTVKIDASRIPTITRTSSGDLEISEVMCVAYKVPLIDVSVSTTGHTITREDILRMPVRTAFGVASTVGGTQLNEETGELSIRGARTDANTYYIDGFRVSSLDGVQRLALNEVAVYTGGIPAKYGDVTGGVIALETKPIRATSYGYRSYSSRPSRSRTKRRPSYQSTNRRSLPAYVEPDEVSLNTFSMDRFTPIYENDFLSPIGNPNSTFSIDVDRASWTYIQNQYKHGLQVSRDAVKLEEMVNAFNYRTVKVPKDELMHVEVERSECAWNKKSELVTIHLKAKDLPEDTKRKPHNFVFLIDVSGSMSSSNKFGLLRAGLIKFVETLQPDDRVAIVTYAGHTGVVLPPTLCTDHDKIIMSLDRLNAGGGTNGIGGIQAAYELAEQNYDPELNNRIILCTDGDFNVGISNPTELEDFIALRRGRGIYLTALGFGMGNYRNDVLESLADNGDGNHFYINSLNECKRVLVDEVGNLLNIARDVKLNVEFNPNFVAEYRLIGYENRLLKPKDFTDDTKDAGEIGYGHSVTAVYEIVPGKAKVDASKFDNATESGGNTTDLAIVKLRYKSFEDSSSVERQYTLAATAKAEKSELLNTVVSFGLLLRDSAFKGKMTKEELAEMAAKLKENEIDVEKLKEMIARYQVI